MCQEYTSGNINDAFLWRVIRQSPAICAAQPTPVAEAHVGHGSSRPGKPTRQPHDINAVWLIR